MTPVYVAGANEHQQPKCINNDVVATLRTLFRSSGSCTAVKHLNVCMTDNDAGRGLVVVVLVLVVVVFSS